MPITRLQWAAWLDDNLAEFKQLLPTAHIRRRAGNTRIRARPDLPPRAHRIQAQADTGMLQTVWAKRLAGRIGWHGVQTTTEKKMFFLECHDRNTFFIDLEPNRVGTDLAYVFNGDFDLMQQLKPLGSLDAAYPNDVVSGVSLRCGHRFVRRLRPHPSHTRVSHHGGSAY